MYDAPETAAICALWACIASWTRTGHAVSDFVLLIGSLNGSCTAWMSMSRPPLTVACTWTMPYPTSTAGPVAELLVGEGEGVADAVGWGEGDAFGAALCVGAAVADVVGRVVAACVLLALGLGLCEDTARAAC